MAREKRTGRTDTVSALAILQDHLAGADEPVEAGFKTARQWATEWGKSDVHAGSLLRRGVATGGVDVKDFRVAGPSGIRKPVPHYRIKGAT